MKTKKLISLLCAAAMTVSSFAGLTITASAAAGDKIEDVVTMQDFNSLETGVLLDGFDEAGKKSDAVPYFNMVTTGRKDVGHYTDKAGEEIVTGNVYSVMEKEDATDKYLRLGFPMFGDFIKNGRYGHFDFVDANKAAVTYTADATKDYVIEFDAKFTNGMAKGVVSTEGSYNPVLRIGTFDSSGKKDNAVAIDKAALSIGDEWVHIKSVTSTKGTKVYLDNSDEYAVSSTTATAVNAFGLYSTDGQTTISPPADVYNAGLDDEILDADKHTFSPTVDIDNFMIYTAEPEVEADITINYKDEAGNTLKEASTVSGIVGKTFKMSESYKAAIDADGDNYYKYKSGAEDITVAASDNVVNLVFESVAKPTVTFKATTGDSKTELAVIGTAKAMPGAKTEAVYAKEYIQADGKWYQKNDGRKGGGKNHDAYDLTATAGDEDSVVTVDYKPAFNVVSVLEAEDSENAVETTESDKPAGGTYGTTYPMLNASGGVWAQSTTGSTYPTGFYTEPVTEAGTYEVTIRTRDFKRPAAVAKVTPGEGDAVTMTKIGETPSDGGISFTTIKVELAAGEYIWVGKSGEIGTDVASDTKLINDVDYIVVKDANKKAETDPVVTFSYANKVASLTSDKDRTVKAVLIHAQYGGGILTDVKQHPVDILSGDTPTTVNIEEPVYEGDKFMVWETLDGLKPLLVPAYTVPEGSGDSKPKFTVTVADDIANGTVTPDKTQAEQGETVTLTVTPAQGYVLDTLTVKDAEGADVAVTNNTFAMPAKNVTVTAAFKPVITGTVTIAGTPKVGETITATAEGLPAGAAAKYQWQLATAQDGDFTDVQGANEVSKKLSSVSQDKYVRVVVTADGFDGQIVSNVLGPVAEADVPITKYAITKVVDPADTATVTTTIGDGQEVSEVTDGINVTVNATATGDNAVKEIVVTETEGGAAVAFNAETKTFKMPAKAVTVTVKTAPMFAITKAAAENGTFNVSAEKAAEGTKIDITDITPAEGYAVDTVKFNDTIIEAVDGAYSFTMPAAAVTVTVTFASTAPAPVVSYDFDNSAEGFEATSRITREIVTDDTTTGAANGTKVLKFTNAANAGNGMALAKLNFADKVQNATSVTVEFDTYSAGSGRTNFSLFDGNIRGFDGTTYTKGGFNKTGVLFAQGSDAADVYKVRNDNKNIPYGEWVHTVVEIDYVTQKINYTITKAGGEAVVSESIAYLDDTSKYATGLELYSWQNNAVAYIDNVKVFAEIGTPNTVTINYVDTEGNVIKTAETDAAVNTLPYVVDAAKKATFEANDIRYTYKADGSTDTITAVSDDAKTITLVFDKVAYETTTLTAKLDNAVKSGVVIKVKGTPAAEGAATVDTTVTTGDDGTATIKLLPGTYTYSIDTAPEYAGVSETALTVGQNNEITLAANSQALAAMDIDSSAMNTGILTTAADSKVVGKLLVKQYADADKTEEMATPADFVWTASNDGVAVAADGTVTITSAVTAGEYTITATAGEINAEYTFTVAETGTETVTLATEDFENENKNNFVLTNGAFVDTFKDGKVLKLGLTDGAAATMTLDAPVTAATGDTVKVTWTAYNGWLSSGKDTVWTLKNSNDEVVLSYSYTTGDCMIKAVTLAGVAQEVTAFNFQQNGSKQNGWGSFTYANQNSVELTLNADGSATVNFIKGSSTVGTYTVAAADTQLTAMNIKSAEMLNHATNDDRSGGFDNFKTTIIK